MSEDLTRLDYSKLRGLAEDMKKIGESYRSIYNDRLYGSFEPKLKAAFQGDDAETATGRLDGLRDDFDAMYNTINAYGKHLENAADAYEMKMKNMTSMAQNLTTDRKR